MLTNGHSKAYRYASACGNHRAGVRRSFARNVLAFCAWSVSFAAPPAASAAGDGDPPPGSDFATPHPWQSFYEPPEPDPSPYSYWQRYDPEADTAWRAPALARIERHRKANLAVRVLGENGLPTAVARVAARMRRHEFGFGSAVAAKFLVGEDPNTPKYRETVKRLFNKVTIESDLKWPHWEDPDNLPLALAAVRWLRGNGFSVRGHCLIWAGWSWMPDDIYDIKDDREALQERVTEHLRDEASALKGDLTEWDVVNEPYWYDELQRRLGKDAMVRWYQLVHRIDPAARLYINEYGILSYSSGYGDSRLTEYESTIRFLRENAAPLHGVGVQGHFSWHLTPPTAVLERLDRLSALGMPIQITEFDVDITDEKQQADYMRDFMTAVFSHPAVNGIIMWGFWEGRHWRPDSALFRLDWSAKPCGEVWQDLVFREWWTEVEGVTDAAGRFETRGFRGDYEVRVTAGSRSRTVHTTLPDAGSTVEIHLTQRQSDTGR